MANPHIDVTINVGERTAAVPGPFLTATMDGKTIAYEVERARASGWVPEKRTKVAIVGFSDSTREDAPYRDLSFEVWGLGSLHTMIPRFDRWFEVHDDTHLNQIHKDQVSRLWNFLAACKVPVYMREVDARVPTSVRLPIEAMNERFFPGDQALGGPYWTNTIAYMIAIAIMEGFEVIHLYGVDMAHKDEYVIQRPGVTYMIGVARGAGIKVVLPKASALMHARSVYGYETEDNSDLNALRKIYVDRRERTRRKHEETLATLHQLDGCMEEIEGIIQLIDERRRGMVVGG